MLSLLLNRPCTIWRREASGTIDELGDETQDETATVTVCELQRAAQRPSDEPPLAGEFSSTVWTAFFPAGTDIDTGDRVEVDGRMYEMVGDPWPARNPRTQAESHVEATLKRTAGQEDGS